MALNQGQFSFAFRARPMAQTAASAGTSRQHKHFNTSDPMKWYYVDNGQQAGPVEETGFSELMQLGKLRADTLVWREGLVNWERFDAACPQESAALAPPPAAAARESGVTEAVCA